MDITKKRTLLSRQAKRIASLKSKIRKPTVAAKKTKVFASLEHMLNATALYRIGEYDRASLAFQQAMAETDAPEMLESLEDAQAQLEGGDSSVDPLETDAKADDECADYLQEDEESEDDDEDESELDLDLLVDETATDVLTDEEDFTVDPSEVEFSVASRAKKNIRALKK